MKRVFIVNSIKLPTIEEISKGGLPMFLLRWPLHRDQLPQHVQDELVERKFEGLPTVNINLPFNAGAVVSLKKVLDLIIEGNRIGIEIEYVEDEMRVTGKNTCYLDVCPHSINLKDPKILPSVWDAEEGTDADKEYAKLLNQAIREATEKRMAKRAITTSGTVGGEIIDDSVEVVNASQDDSVF